MSVDPQSVLNTVGAEGVKAWLVYFPSRSGKRGKEGDKKSKRMRRGAEKVKGVTVGERTSLREWGSHRERKTREEAKRNDPRFFTVWKLQRESYSRTYCLKKKAIKYLGENMKVTLPPYR